MCFTKVGAQWKRQKWSRSANETPQAQRSSAGSQSHDTPAACVCVRTCARPGRQSAGTGRFNPNHHEISPLWQQNLLAFPCSPTNGLLTLQPRNDRIKGHETFRKTFFCHFQWRLLHNSATVALKPQETNDPQSNLIGGGTYNTWYDWFCRQNLFYKAGAIFQRATQWPEHARHVTHLVIFIRKGIWDLHAWGENAFS